MVYILLVPTIHCIVYSIPSMCFEKNHKQNVPYEHM